MSVEPVVSNQLLAEGAEGKEVKALQSRLTTLGYYEGPIDGHFTADVADSVRYLQEDMDIKRDGIVGSKTYAALARKEDDPTLGEGYMTKDGIFDLGETTTHIVGDTVYTRDNGVVTATPRSELDRVEMVPPEPSISDLFSSILTPSWSSLNVDSYREIGYCPASGDSPAGTSVQSNAVADASTKGKGQTGPGAG